MIHSSYNEELSSSNGRKRSGRKNEGDVDNNSDSDDTIESPGNTTIVPGMLISGIPARP